MKKPKPTELDFDLADVRKAKRLMNRAIAELLKIERRLMRKRPKPRKGTPEEIALALEMYRKADEFVKGGSDGR